MKICLSYVHCQLRRRGCTGVLIILSVKIVKTNEGLREKYHYLADFEDIWLNFKFWKLNFSIKKWYFFICFFFLTRYGYVAFKNELYIGKLWKPTRTAQTSSKLFWIFLWFFLNIHIHSPNRPRAWRRRPSNFIQSLLL